jgi:hypothetical protein
VRWRFSVGVHDLCIVSQRIIAMRYICLRGLLRKGWLYAAADVETFLNVSHRSRVLYTGPVNK